MKTPSLFKALLALVTVLSLFTTGTTPARADRDDHRGVWDSRHHYRRDNYGYWNEQNRYTPYVTWHHHHGYWDTHGSTRIFINID